MLSIGGECMNTEIDLQKMLKLVLKKWKLVVVFCVIGALAVYVYAANFASQTLYI